MMMTTSSRTIESIINDATETLKVAEYGYKMISHGKPEEKTIGLRNLVVFGRAVTNVLQNLKSHVNNFEVWYLPIQEEMRADPILKALYELRTIILKKGSINIETHTHIKQFSFPNDMKRFGDPPKNAKGFFIGDKNGGSGWEVVMMDGSIEKLYIDLPEDIGTSSLHLSEIPNIPGSKTKPTLEEIGLYYINYLQNLINSAKSTFLT